MAKIAAIEVGQDEMGHHIYVLEDGPNAQILHAETKVWPIRVENGYLWHWAYENGVSLE